MRHLECTSFWIQQRIRHGDLKVRNIAGKVRPADLYTNYLGSKAKIEQLIGLFGGEFRGGRAEAALLLSPAWSRRFTADVSKGDSEELEDRSRLVGREFAVGRDGALYAVTPPLEAFRIIISHAATYKTVDPSA